MYTFYFCGATKIKDDKGEAMLQKCLMYPALQKFYNALTIVNQIDSRKYIFETIPQIDSFFSEMRNITFVMQESFNSSELKKVYEQEREKFLNNEVMKWFNQTRVETIHKHPFKLEKALYVEFYLPNFSTKTTLDKLTINNDLNFSDLYKKLKLFLDTNYSNCIELYLSTTITFLENGNEVDIYSVIQKGIEIMYAMVVDIMRLYPCNCEKCNKLKNEIKRLIDAVSVKKITFSSDLYYADKKLSIGSVICASLGSGCSLLSPPAPIKNSFLDITDMMPCDMSFLKVFAYYHIVLARIQRSESSESELMPAFLIIYENDTFSFYGPITGTNKSTFYRAISDVTKIINNNNIKAILILTEGYHYANKDIEQLQSMKYEERIKEASSVVILFTLISKNLDDIYGIEVDYENLFDGNYIDKQLKNIIKYEPYNHMAYPIFKALHK